MALARRRAGTARSTRHHRNRRPRAQLAGVERGSNRGKDRRAKSGDAYRGDRRTARRSGNRPRQTRIHSRSASSRRLGIQQRTPQQCSLRQRMGRHRGVAVQVPLFNRNQGNVAAAGAERDRAQLEKLRVALTLRERASSVLDQYANDKLMAVEYRDAILPPAKKAYALMLEKYGQMLASYPRVIDSQRKLFGLQAEYIAALQGVWITGIALQGFLLTDGLEAPARPGEVDRPVRET